MFQQELHSHLTSIDSVSLKALLLLGISFLFFWFLMLFGRVIKRYRGIAATASMFVNTVIASWMFFEVSNKDLFECCFRWIDVEGLKVNFGVRIDSLSALFAMIVCFISFLVHLFSIEYLRGDKNLEKYFGYLSLFTFSMLGIIFSQNMLQLFVFWELVGFSSYLLIGFWYQNTAAVEANKKAFLVNRVGDVGFLLGIMIIFALCQTMKISEIKDFIATSEISQNIDFQYLIKGNVISKGWLIVAGLGISFGAMAKSAQFPFSIWLPNAMEGPTPVSALIHAATMVAAGIYLLARFTFILPDFVLDFLAIIGVLTAFLAAITAISQTDIKRVLAYSTVSQLGYMVMAIGVRSYDSALFHLLTHAFFKAALFLCAGAIIYSLHKVDTAYGIKKLYPDFDEQNMNQMGGMSRKMPFVFWVYTIALCGIIGVPFFTGFLSKDAILLNTFNWASARGGFYLVIPIVALFTVGMTSFYMLRQYFMVFFGENRMTDTVNNAPKGMKAFITKERLEAPHLMKISPFILAMLTFSFVFSLNPFDGSKSWVYSKLPSVNYLNPVNYPHTFSHLFISVLSIVLMLTGVFLAYQMYEKNKFSGLRHAFKSNHLVYKLSFDFWLVDVLVQKIIVIPTTSIAKYTSKFDKNVIDKIPDLIVFFNIHLAKLFALLDVEIFDRIVRGIAVVTLIFGYISAWIDKNIIDGFVSLIAFVGKSIGDFAKVIQKGKLQSHVIWSLLLIVLFIGFIYLIK